MLFLAAGTSGCSLKPKRSAAATSRLAPSFAPSGPKTELQECANEFERLPPHDSSPALRSLTPDSVAAVRTGYELLVFATPCWSAAAAVMILKLEPGGWGAETARPASASTEPSLGLITAIPPRRSPRAFCAVRCRPRRMVVVIERPRRPSTRAITRSPKRSVELRAPPRRSS